MAKVCVTGAAGFIGGHVAEKLLRQGHEVTGLDDFSSGKRDTAAQLARHPSFRLFEGSIADPQAVAQATSGARWVFHLAAIPSVPLSMKEPERTTAVFVLPQGSTARLPAALTVPGAAPGSAPGSGGTGPLPRSGEPQGIPGWVWLVLGALVVLAGIALRWRRAGRP